AFRRRVDDDKVGVAARLKRTLLRIDTRKLCRISTGAKAERGERKPRLDHALAKQQRQIVRQRGNPCLRQIIRTAQFRGSAWLVSGDYGAHNTFLKSREERLLLATLASGR